MQGTSYQDLFTSNLRFFKPYSLRIWDATNGTWKQTLGDHNGCVNAVAFSPDGKAFASASDDTAPGCHYRLETDTRGPQRLGQSCSLLTGWQGPCISFAVLTRPVWPSSVCFQAPVVASSRTVVSFEADAMASQSRTVRSDEADARTLPSGEKATARTQLLWPSSTIASGYATYGLINFNPTLSMLSLMAFSLDGKVLASASDHTVRLWYAITGAQKQKLKTNITITSLLFSEDGRYLKTERGLLSLNSVSSDTCLHHERSMHGISVNDEWVTQDGQNLIWLPLDYRAACSALFNNMLVLGNPLGQIEFVSS
ncbi:hypothetical protein Egran_00747 [Elaphomyces granulatus]|uniref:Uncharacterized protein n=1 Tax=Elaphomyces granulatus TaxID=519963 RepID=A0A232M579_9EURO|nr:hypothetical protein Egran_00747 [Elaphomyces granulatus]